MRILDYIKFKKKLNTIQNTGFELNSKMIVFNTIRCYPLPMHQELFLAYTLAVSGARVKILFDDGLLNHWDTVQIHNGNIPLTPYKQIFIKKFIVLAKKYFILWIYKHKNIEVMYYSDLLKNSKQNLDLCQLDEQNAESSVRRYFESGVMDITKKDHLKYYQESLLNCSVSKKIAEQVKAKINPDLFITSHGIYSCWGPAFTYLKNNGVPVLVYGAHAYKAREIIISDVVAQVLSEDSNWKSFEETKLILNGEEKEKIIRYFENRIKHKSHDTKIYYGNIEEFTTIKIDKNKNMTFGIFPNIIWDGDVFERDTIFSGIIDWIETTINFFRESEHNLVIRFHPAEESLWKDSVRLYSVLSERVKDLKEIKNVFLIQPTVKLDVYEFVKENIDVGLIYDGVLSMELTYLGIPVISCAKSRYTGAGFVFEPQSISEYKTFLEIPEKLVYKFNENIEHIMNKLYIYAYWYFFISGYQLPIFDEKKMLTINYTNIRVDEIDPTKNQSYYRTIEKITSHIK